MGETLPESITLRGIFRNMSLVTLSFYWCLFRSHIFSCQDNTYCWRGSHKSDKICCTISPLTGRRVFSFSHTWRTYVYCLQCLKNSLSLRIKTEPVTGPDLTAYVRFFFFLHISGPETRQIPLHILQPVIGWDFVCRYSNYLWGCTDKTSQDKSPQGTKPELGARSWIRVPAFLAF